MVENRTSAENVGKRKKAYIFRNRNAKDGALIHSSSTDRLQSRAVSIVLVENDAGRCEYTNGACLWAWIDVLTLLRVSVLFGVNLER